MYPFNRDAIDLPGDDVISNLCQKTGISYIPLYTPVKRRISEVAVASPRFTQSELLEFEQCCDNGQTCENPCYKLWLETYWPELPLLHESPPLSRHRQAELHSTLSPFLALPDPPRPKPKAQPHSSRVLTSAENLKALQEKDPKARKSLSETRTSTETRS